MSRKTRNTSAAPVAVDVEKAPEIEAVAPADQAIAAAPAVVTHEIAGKPEKGFYRAGRYWPRAGTPIDRADFTDDQWSAIEGEPKLTIKPL